MNQKLGELAASDPARRALEERRTELRAAARLAADRARDPAALRREVEHLRTRLERIDDRPIGDAWTQKRNYRWINDPGAYSNVINRKIEEGDRPERDEIVRRIDELELVLQESGSDRSIEKG